MKKDIETRIREIQAEVAAIDEFAEGSIASSRKPYRLKDGTARLASPQYRFKSKGARGKQVSKYIPPSAVARVKKLIENVESIERAGPKDRREALPRIFVIQGERGRATLLPGKKRTHSLPFASGRSSPCLRLMPRKAIKWPACSG